MYRYQPLRKEYASQRQHKTVNLIAPASAYPYMVFWKPRQPTHCHMAHLHRSKPPWSVQQACSFARLHVNHDAGN
jgi:hypothetical protein